MKFANCKNIFDILNSLPIQIRHSEHAPWDLLCDPSIGVNCCDWAKEGICRCEKKIDSLKLMSARIDKSIMTTHMTQMIWALQHIISWTPSNVAVEGNFQRLINLALNLQFLEVFNALSWGLNLFKIMSREVELCVVTHLDCNSSNSCNTSSDPPRTQLLGKSGLYSHIAVWFSMAAIFVIWPIMSTLARFTTCSKQL